MRFESKTAVVTGAGRGIGEAYATALAAEGAKVVVAELDRDNGERVAKEIEQAGGSAMFAEVDVSAEESAQSCAEATLAAFGRVDILVNNAAIYGDMELNSLLDVPLDYYKRFMAVNMDGALIMTRAFREALVADGGGVILNQSSTAAYMGAGYYGIAKLALNGITQTCARELGHAGVRVNAIAPGPTDTEATRTTVPEGLMRPILAQMPISRLGDVDEIVAAALFLVSDEASFVTGQVFNIDGGQIMKL